MGFLVHGAIVVSFRRVSLRTPKKYSPFTKISHKVDRGDYYDSDTIGREAETNMHIYF